MKVEIGKRYRFERTDGQSGQPEVTVIELYHGQLGFMIGSGLDEACYSVNGDDGIVSGCGRLVPVDVGIADNAAQLPPIFGHDPDGFARLQRTFREKWDFSWGAR